MGTPVTHAAAVVAPLNPGSRKKTRNVTALARGQKEGRWRCAPGSHRREHISSGRRSTPQGRPSTGTPDQIVDEALDALGWPVRRGPRLFICSALPGPDAFCIGKGVVDDAQARLSFGHVIAIQNSARKVATCMFFALIPGFRYLEPGSSVPAIQIARNSPEMLRLTPCAVTDPCLTTHWTDRSNRCNLPRPQGTGASNI